MRYLRFVGPIAGSAGGANLRKGATKKPRAASPGFDCFSNAFGRSIPRNDRGLPGIEQVVHAELENVLLVGLAHVEPSRVRAAATTTAENITLCESNRREAVVDVVVLTL